ncbi:MAG: AlbA family DNA-binding domain-containing protein [Planctomycetota bacterium]|jgi:hypothetical protein
MMIPKTFDVIGKADIEALIADGVRERRTIEYKSALPGRTDKEKHEFLADVSSLANSAGGYLIFGIEAEDAVPTKAIGLECVPDKTVLRLEQIVRANLHPRLLGMRTKAISGFPEGPVILMRIPRSWTGPHMIGPQDKSRFFTRNSGGKHAMDSAEIRESFLLSGSLPEKIKQFRDSRLGLIMAGETPVASADGARLVLHVLPVHSFIAGPELTIERLKAKRVNLCPIAVSSWDDRINLDGLLTFSRADSSAPARSYCQIFRSGRIEAVWATVARGIDGPSRIPGEAYERYVILALTDYVGSLKSLDVSCPLVVFLSLVGASGATLAVSSRVWDARTASIDRDMVLLPDILIEDYADVGSRESVAAVLRPAFDAVWNACGYARSYNYDEDGNWAR